MPLAFHSSFMKRPFALNTSALKTLPSFGAAICGDINGGISFTVNLAEDNHQRLRSGLKADVHVVNSIKENVLRLPNSNYYVGPGEYTLFVFNGDDTLVPRIVHLGECSYDKVEVIDGLNAGDHVVISDMKQYKNVKSIKVN